MNLFVCQVDVEGTTKEPGTPLRAPTMESGLVTACKDTCYGDLKLQLWEKKYDGSKGKVRLAQSCVLSDQIKFPQNEKFSKSSYTLHVGDT